MTEITEYPKDNQEQGIDWTATDQHIRKVISDQLNVDLADVLDSARFQDDPLNADSLDMVELVMALEEDFGVQVEDEAVEHIQTVRQMIDHVFSLVSLGAQVNS